MGKMKELGLLDCEDRQSIEENFERMKKSSGGVSSWNDLTDKPFYKTKKNVFSVENTASEQTQLGMYGYNFTEPYPESKPDVLTVTFDGKVYECATMYEDMFDGIPTCLFGNLALLGSGVADTGEPFIGVWFNMDVGMGTLGVFGVVTDAAETVHSVSIESVNIKKLDYEYTYQSDLNVQNPTEIGYVKNNPFFVNVVGQYTFDGNLDGKEVVDMATIDTEEVKYVKVADTIPQVMDENKWDIYTYAKSKYELNMDMNYADYLLRNIGTGFWYESVFSYINTNSGYGYPDFLIVWKDVAILGKQFTPGVYMKCVLTDGNVTEYTKRMEITHRSYASLVGIDGYSYPTVNRTPVENHIVLQSATAGSLKHFEIRIEDNGELTVQEIGKV